MSIERYRSRQDMIDAGLSLDQQNDALLEKLAVLKMQIEGAKADAAATGNYLDKDWYNRATFAYRMTARDHQQVQRELGERNKAQKKKNHYNAENSFITICRRRLNPELFESIMQEYHESQQQEESQA